MRSLDQTTMREPIAVTTQNIHTRETVIMMFYISQRSYLPFTASCWFDGRKRKDGETFPAKDKCNDCVCMDGEVTCTLLDCTYGESVIVIFRPESSLLFRVF